MANNNKSNAANKSPRFVVGAIAVCENQSINFSSSAQNENTHHINSIIPTSSLEKIINLPPELINFENNI